MENQIQTKETGLKIQKALYRISQTTTETHFEFIQEKPVEARLHFLKVCNSNYLHEPETFKLTKVANFNDDGTLEIVEEHIMDGEFNKQIKEGSEMEQLIAAQVTKQLMSAKKLPGTAEIMVQHHEVIKQVNELKQLYKNH